MYLADLAATQNLCAKHGPNKKRGPQCLGLGDREKDWRLPPSCSRLASRRRPATRVYASLGDTTRSPIGWVEFCADNPGDCRGGATQPRDIVMSQTAWRDLLRVNNWVNETIKPMTDMDHWGVIEKWSLPI